MAVEQLGEKYRCNVCGNEVIVAKVGGGLEREPHRNRTCNLLIKSLTYDVLTSHFSYKTACLY